MGKPLLTDEILERARRGERLTDKQEFGYYNPNSDLSDHEAAFHQQWEDEEYEGYREGETVRIPVDASIVKSRRIETVKREEFRGKINKILFWVVVLVILLVLAVLFI